MKSPEKAVFETILAIAVLFALVLLPLAARAESHLPHQPPAFSDFDQDGDGFVSEDEFNTTRAARHEAMAKEGRPMKGMASAPAFSDIDSDGDGRLSEAELTAAQQAHRKAMHEAHGGPHGGKHHGHRCPMHHGGKMPTFEDIDTDGDGCISPAEFNAHHAAYERKPEG
jgi:Ca2+-binding EF-hand superfamily protein